jgi:hypothetical protein
VEVSLEIKDLDGQIATEKFAIGTPNLIGVNAVDGTGTMNAKSSSTVQWLLIPRREAAPTEDMEYQVISPLRDLVLRDLVSLPFIRLGDSLSMY